MELLSPANDGSIDTLCPRLLHQAQAPGCMEELTHYVQEHGEKRSKPKPVEGEWVLGDPLCHHPISGPGGSWKDMGLLKRRVGFESRSGRLRFAQWREAATRVSSGVGTL